MKTSNKLQQMFEKQANFQTRLGNEAFLFHTPFIKDQILALNCELMEALQTTPWKNWKKQQPSNFKAFREELIDCWHFLINLSLSAGLDEESLFKAFMEKNKINNQRQDEGY